MASIKDVAKMANVSVATVSRVINESNNVQDATKEKVLAVIKQLNYSPNLLGRNLRRLETKKVLILLNTIANQFYAQVVKGIEHKALEHGFSVIICMTHGDPEIEKRNVQMLKTKLVDGAIFLTTEQNGETLSTELKDVFVVQACEPRADFSTPIVSIDNANAAFDATNYLIEMGHHEIAFFGAGNLYGSSAKRELGYRRALKAHNISVKEKWIFTEGFSFNAGIRAGKSLIAQKEMPTAIFCVSDSCAAGAINLLAQHKIKTPEDISVMGFDNTQLSEIYIPSITTLKQPQYDIGYQAMALLLNKMNGESLDNKQILLDYSIIKRESVKPRKDVIAGQQREE